MTTPHNILKAAKKLLMDTFLYAVIFLNNIILAITTRLSSK